MPGDTVHSGLTRLIEVIGTNRFAGQEENARNPAHPRLYHRLSRVVLRYAAVKR